MQPDAKLPGLSGIRHVDLHAALARAACNPSFDDGQVLDQFRAGARALLGEGILLGFITHMLPSLMRTPPLSVEF